jgi:hypothetical protein
MNRGATTTENKTFARFRRDVRWIAVAVEGGTAGEVVAFFAGLASLGVALTPLIWLR